MNRFFVQVKGPFSANEEITNKIIENYPNFSIIRKIGIQCPKTHIVYINGQKFEIGKTEILEFSEVEITSLKFQQLENELTIIDCIVE